MTDDYTPTTEVVREIYLLGVVHHRRARVISGRGFDRWLAAERAEAAKEAREDERERIAQRIEAVDPVEWALAGQHAGLDAARIARTPDPNGDNT